MRDSISQVSGFRFQVSGLRPPAGILLLALLAGAARAEETPAATNAVSAPAPLVTRDPFWPIGYAPVGDLPAASGDSRDAPKTGLRIDNLSPAQQEALGRRLKVSAIMKTGAGYLGRVNNQLVGPGDEITVEFEGQQLTLVVRGISQDSVQIEPKK
jgi:hypothetical protein